MTESKMIDFDIRYCCTCGIPIPLTTGHVGKLRESHATFYCPNGHSQWFPGETEIRKLEERIQTCQNIRREKEKQIDELNKKVNSYKMLFRREQKKQKG